LLKSRCERSARAATRASGALYAKQPLRAISTSGTQFARVRLGIEDAFYRDVIGVVASKVLSSRLHDQVAVVRTLAAGAKYAGSALENSARESAAALDLGLEEAPTQTGLLNANQHRGRAARVVDEAARSATRRGGTRRGCKVAEAKRGVESLAGSARVRGQGGRCREESAGSAGVRQLRGAGLRALGRVSHELARPARYRQPRLRKERALADSQRRSRRRSPPGAAPSAAPGTSRAARRARRARLLIQLLQLLGLLDAARGEAEAGSW
jgi:hypothetical protein